MQDDRRKPGEDSGSGEDAIGRPAQVEDYGKPSLDCKLELGVEQAFLFPFRLPVSLAVQVHTDLPDRAKPVAWTRPARNSSETAHSSADSAANWGCTPSTTSNGAPSRTAARDSSS